ncbi:hypothetical protein [Metabacillus sp. RGM 3146]|uniref:hypothetical protein n=1 Tax=Metabacillus sp. RGM 3146 TaxID=3401092 RepID=UPI003B9DA106
MIRQLTEKDHEQCMNFVSQKAAENLFIIGDIEAYGYEQPFQKIWGEFDSNGELKAVLLKYEANYLPFASGRFNAEAFSEIMKNDPDWKMLSGLEEVTAQLEPHLVFNEEKKKKLYYAKCSSLIADPELSLREV